jgi:hypothetical protein
MALAQCPECSKDVSRSARSCPHCGYAFRKSIAPYALLTLLLIPFAWCGAVRLASSSRPEQPGPAELEFCLLIAQYAHRFQAAESARQNDVVLSSIRAERRAALESLVGGRKMSGWEGRVRSISTDGDGSASVSIELPCGARIVTGPFDPVPPGTTVYRQLAKLSSGTPVTFDAELADLGDRRDWIKEVSLTERGSMLEPDFVAEFSRVIALQ